MSFDIKYLMKGNHAIIKILSLMCLVIHIMSANLSFSAEPIKKFGDSVKKTIDRETRFLNRAIDDVNQLILYISEDIKGLEKQIDAIALFEPQQRENDLREILELYRNYDDRLKGFLIEFQADLAGYYTGEKGLGWMSRYEEMEKVYREVEGRLKENVRDFESSKAEIEAELRQMGIELLKLEKLKQIEKKLDEKEEKQIIKAKKTEEKENGHIDFQIFALLNSIRELKDMVKHFDVLIQKGNDELDWISMKARDCAVLNKAASGIRSMDIINLEHLYGGVIKNYESDINQLRRKIERIDIKRTNVAGVGTLKELDRSKELLEHLENFRSRYERHLNWLKVQIGSYEADLTEIRWLRTH